MIDGYLQSREVEEAKLDKFIASGWKPVEAIDPERLSCEEGYFVRVVPYDDGDKIAYRYETVFDVQKLRRDIERHKAELTGSDYKVIKCYEASLLGEPMPYDLTPLIAERQGLRDRINELETSIASLNDMAD